MEDQFKLNPEILEDLEHSFARATIDRFATAANTQKRTYNSFFIEEGCAGVDAFS
jgi:hypothetical protein